MKDVVSPVPPEEVRNVIRKCLQDAALVNYTRICNEAKLEREVLHPGQSTNNYAFCIKCSFQDQALAVNAELFNRKKFFKDLMNLVENVDNIFL